MIPHVKAVIDGALNEQTDRRRLYSAIGQAVAVGNKAGLFGYHTLTDCEPHQHDAHAQAEPVPAGRRRLRYRSKI